MGRAVSGIRHGHRRQQSTRESVAHQFAAAQPVSHSSGDRPIQWDFHFRGAPVFVNPDGSGGVSQSLYGFSRNLVTPYVQQYNLTVQYQMPKGWIVETGYIGSHGIHLLVEPSLNQALLVNSSSPVSYTNGVTVTQNSSANASIRVPVPGFSPSGLNLVTNGGYSHYDGLILEVSHAFAHGFQFKTDYTFSRSTDDDSGPSGSDLDSYQGNQLIPRYNRGVSDFNEPHRLVFQGVWTLPGPKSGWKGQLIGNWGLSGVYTIQSGLPFSISSTNGGGLAGLNGSVTVRANQVPGCTNAVTPGAVTQNLNDFVNAACFVAVPNVAAGTVLSGLSAQQGPGTGTYVVNNNGVATDTGIGSLFGTIGRNTYHGPNEHRFDLSLSKAFPVHKFLGEKGNIQFRAEAFKVFNNVIFANPAANISNSTFGHITSTLDSTGRILQLAVKVGF